MKLYTFDDQGRKAAIIERYSSLQWTRRYNTPGAFELHCAPEYRQALLPGTLLQPDNQDEAALVEAVRIDTDKANYKDSLTVTGKFLSGLAGNRVLQKSLSYRGGVEALLYRLASENLATPQKAERAIARLTLAPLKGIGGDLAEYVADMGTALDSVLAALAQAHQLGWRITFSPANGGMVFEVYQGLDRRIGQRENNPALFADTEDNLISGQYQYSLAKSANVALVAGEETDDGRTTLTLGAGAGMERREAFIDARRIRRKVDTETTLTEKQYIAALTQYGNEKLSLLTPSEAVEAQIISTAGRTYRRDFDLGDLVTVRLGSLGVLVEARIVELPETYEGSQMTVRPIFGKDTLALVQHLQKQSERQLI